jgi:ATPase subunit of ABC transporter with duplicated ATPase domains
MRKRLSKDEYVAGVLEGNRMILSRAITLIESQLDTDKALAREVLETLLPHTGNSVRLGITGVPGVGKSTFIETFGKHLTNQGKKLQCWRSTQVVKFQKAVFLVTRHVWKNFRETLWRISDLRLRVSHWEGNS